MLTQLPTLNPSLLSQRLDTHPLISSLSENVRDPALSSNEKGSRLQKLGQDLLNPLARLHHELDQGPRRGFDGPLCVPKLSAGEIACPVFGMSLTALLVDVQIRHLRDCEVFPSPFSLDRQSSLLDQVCESEELFSIFMGVGHSLHFHVALNYV